MAPLSSEAPDVLVSLGPLGRDFKTGIFRVSDRLATGLAERLGSRICFHPVSYAFPSVEYYRKNLRPHGAGIIHVARSGGLLEISRSLDSMIKTNERHSDLLSRVIRKSSRIGMELVDHVYSRLPSSSLTSARVYHSPFYSIPPQVVRRPEIKRFTTIYDLIPITHPQYFEKNVIALMQRIVGGLGPDDYTLCISNATRETLLRHSNCDPQKSFVTPLAASNHFFRSTDTSHNQEVLTRHGIDSPGYLLSLCTFEVRKNLDALVNAYTRLRDSRAIPPETKLVLVGGKGWKSENLKSALAAASDYKNDIIMPGFVPDDDLAAIYSSARVFIYMSLLEGFGLPPLEAMQCGVPVITSNTSSLPEVVGTAGVMLDPHDGDGLDQAIQRICLDNPWHAALGEQSLAKAASFSWDRFIDQTIAAYQVAMKS